MYIPVCRWGKQIAALPPSVHGRTGARGTASSSIRLGGPVARGCARASEVSGSGQSHNPGHSKQDPRTEHARHADTPAFSTSLRAPLLVCKGSIGGLHTYGSSKAERREVRRATRLLSRSQGGTGEAEESARETLRGQTYRDADLSRRQALDK